MLVSTDVTGNCLEIIHPTFTGLNLAARAISNMFCVSLCSEATTTLKLMRNIARLCGLIPGGVGEIEREMRE